MRKIMAATARNALMRRRRTCPCLLRTKSNVFEPDHPVRMHHKSLQLLGHGKNTWLRVKVDNRQFGHQNLLCGIVKSDALRLISGLPRLVKRAIHLRIAISSVVPIPLTGYELMKVAIGIDAARPRIHAQFKMARLRLLDKRHKFRYPQLNIETSLSPHSLDQLPYLLSRIAVTNHQLRFDCQRYARLLQERLCLGDVPLWRRPSFGIIGARGRKWLVGRIIKPLEDNLVNSIPID